MYSSYGYSPVPAINTSWVLIVAFVLAIVGTVLAYIFIMPKDKVKNLNKFWYTLHNIFHFKQLLLETILKALYIFSTLLVLLTGFFGMFASFLTGFLTMLLGPIAVRLGYEAVMMFIVLVQNTTAIKTKLYEDSGASAPAAPPVERKPPKEFVFCAVCGTRYNKLDGRCPGCGQPAYSRPAAPQQAAPNYAPQQPMNQENPNAPEHRRYQNPTL